MTNARNIAERVLWTFVQAFFGAIPVTFTLDHQHLEAVGYAGLTAGIAAVVSLAKNLTTSPATGPTAVLAETLLPVRTASGYDHNPVPPLDPHADLRPPPTTAPKAAKRARNT